MESSDHSTSAASARGANVFELGVTPHGVVTFLPYHGRDRWAIGVATCFGEHEAAGLTELAAIRLPHDAHATVRFWRDVAADLVRSLCHLPAESPDIAAAVDPPTAATLAGWTLNAPPMQGAEYIEPAMLRAVWQRQLDWVVERAAGCGGLGVFLKTYAPHWTRVGRVTLHLAENKGDPEYPFAFMATYAAGMSAAGRIRRLPLAGALKEYAGTRGRPELIKLLSPLHTAAKRSALIADLVETRDIFHPQVWTPAEAHDFLKEIPLYEESGLLAQLPNWWRKRPRPRVAVTIDGAGAGTTLGANALLDFHVSLALGDQPLTEAESEALLSGTDGLVMLRGEWVEVDGEKLREALDHWQRVEREAGSDGLSFIAGMRLLAGATADLKDDHAAETKAAWSDVMAGGRLREALTALRAPAALDGATPTGFEGTLRHYQVEGLNWLWFCSSLGLGCCLADDMGLGKTIQVLAALLRYKQQTPETARAPSLLVVPASLIGNWKAETFRFAPGLRLMTIHPSETPKQLLTTLKTEVPRDVRNADLVVTTYAMLSRLKGLSRIDWHWVILDEAQAVKNPSTSQARAVKQLKGSARVALTGTPVENRLGDLWSIFDFLNPGLLGSVQRFKAFAKTLEKREHARYAPLRNLVAPYILRRMKTDPAIAPDLPDKTEMQVFCGLSRPQAVLYQQHVTALARALKQLDGDGMKRRGLVLGFLMRFKQICNHPSQLTGDGLYDPAASAKFERLADICGEIASRGEKALVFTQFRELTDPLAEYLAVVFGRNGLVLHGGTGVKQRKRLVDAFDREDGPPFFVLSIKAGGTGLNLTAASHVIHVDRWWNPAVENQATDRAFRIGQRRNVLVHKFVTRGTIEERIDMMLRDKQAMADALLGDGPGKTLTEMNDDELIDLVSLDIERART